jgi:hypothetical protein
MKNYILVLCFCLLNTIAKCQKINWIIKPTFAYNSMGESSKFSDYYMVSINDKSGMIDNNGNIIIPIIYPVMFPFKNDRARCLKNNKWGYVDKNGKEIIPFIYEAAWDFSEGLACAKVKDFYQFIDLKGDIAIPNKFQSDSYFGNGLASIRQNYNGYQYIDKKGNIMFPDTFFIARKFVKGIAFVQYGNSKNYEAALINTKGEKVLSISKLEPQKEYNGLDILINTRYLGEDGFIHERAMLNGFINSSQKRIENETAASLISKSGRTIIPFQYGIKNISEVHNGIFSYEANGKYGLCDTLGKRISPFIYRSVSTLNDNRIRVVEENDKYGFINTKGESIIPCTFEGAKDFCNGFSSVVVSGKWGFIDTLGRNVTPFVFDEVLDVKNNKAWVKFEGKWGQIAMPSQKNTLYEFKPKILLDTFLLSSSKRMVNYLKKLDKVVYSEDTKTNFYKLNKLNIMLSSEKEIVNTYSYLTDKFSFSPNNLFSFESFDFTTKQNLFTVLKQFGYPDNIDTNGKEGIIVLQYSKKNSTYVQQLTLNITCEYNFKDNNGKKITRYDVEKIEDNVKKLSKLKNITFEVKTPNEHYEVKAVD